MEETFSNQPPNIFINPEEKRWAMLCHLLSFAGYLVPPGNIVFPLINILAPLVVWLLKREEMPFVDYNGKEVLNFQISLIIYRAIAFILALILIGFVFLYILFVFNLIVTIVAAIKASQGEYYRYPFSIRFIK